MTKTGSFTMFL